MYLTDGVGLYRVIEEQRNFGLAGGAVVRCEVCYAPGRELRFTPADVAALRVVGNG